jgi:hypothetical protein
VADYANIYDLDAGKIRRVRVFVDRQAALEAVGCGSSRAAGYWRAMSQRNVEVVRVPLRPTCGATWKLLWRPFDPEVETYDHDIPDAGEYRGVEGLLSWQADWDREWKAGAGSQRSSSTLVSASSPCCTFMQRVDRAALIWNGSMVRSARCVRANACDSTTTGAGEQALEAVGLRGVGDQE